MDEHLLTDEERRAKLNLETARIPWHDLQRHFASGSVVAVSPDLSLLDVACVLADDDKGQVEAWIVEARIGPVSDAQALHWYQANTLMWAVVVNPWVLVQPIVAEQSSAGGK